MSTWLKMAGVVLALIVASCSPENVQGNDLRCSCQIDNVYNQNIGIQCGKTSHSVSSNTKDKTVSCEKEVLGAVPRGYRYVEGFGLYKIHRTVKDYERARQFCEFEGASLMVPESTDEVERLAPLFKANPTTGQQVFIGVNDIAQEGKYVSLQGVPLTSLGFQTWVPGQPDNYGDEDCLTLTDKGQLNDENCASWQAFLCKRNVSHVPRGYQYVEGFGFYKLYQQTAKFKEAKKRCERDGGYLCVPDTYDEADVLIRLYDKYPDVHFGWVGITDIKEEGHFVTKSGKSLTALQFQNWGSGEPNSDFPLGEDCVVFHESGKLYDAYCEEEKPYTCEIPLDRI